MEDLTYRTIMLYLKRQMRSRRLRYRDLATATQVPESTLQKWFTAVDGPFSRIHLICKFLGITLSDVVGALEREPTRHFEFTEAQQQLFKQDYQHFVLFWLLVCERRTLKFVAKALSLDPAQLKGLLSRLDRVGLLELLPNDRLKLPKLRPVKWKPNGDFIQNTFRDWSMGILQEALSRQKDSDIIVQYFQLSPSSIEELLRDIRELEDKYSRRTISELRNGPREIQGVRFLISHTRGSFLSKLL